MEIVLQALPGVEPALVAELRRAGLAPSEVSDGEVRTAAANLATVRALRTAVAAWIAIQVPTPRPSGALATQVQSAVRGALELMRRQRPRERFSGLRLLAAGAETELMRRVAAELAATTGVQLDDDGDLHMRLRRRGPGWELLVRTTARPLATRPWRLHRYPGALNATIAAAVVEATDPAPSDRFIDLMCGSGTIVIERLARGGVERIVGCDVDPRAIEIAGEHQRAARLRGRVEWIRADVRELSLPPNAVPGGFTTLVANPPWGELLGDHAENDALSRELLASAAALAAPGALLAVLTHDIRRFAGAVEAQREWLLADEHRFFAKGHHPRLFRLRLA